MTKFNKLLQLVHCSYQLWRCQICSKVRRTLGRTRDGHQPLCLHQYTPFEQYPRALMDLDEAHYA